MGLHIAMTGCLLAFHLIIATAQASHVVSPSEVYWRSHLPNTSIPRAIRLLLDPDQQSDQLKVQGCFAVWLPPYTSNKSPMNNLNSHGKSANVWHSFFPKSSLYPGAQLKEGINFNRTIVGNILVPRSEVAPVLFSSKNLAKILDHFSITLDSHEANLIKETLNNCEAPPLEGEEKICTKSLESMVDNVISMLGTHKIQAISTMINGPQHEKMVYKVASPVKQFSDEDKIVVCHTEPYPQAVHYCHTSLKYKVYAMALVGDNGSTVNAIVVCHHDKMGPNMDPICHFLPEDHLIWVHI